MAGLCPALPALFLFYFLLGKHLLIFKEIYFRYTGRSGIRDHKYRYKPYMDRQNALLLKEAAA